MMLFQAVMKFLSRSKFSLLRKWSIVHRCLVWIVRSLFTSAFHLWLWDCAFDPHIGLMTVMHVKSLSTLYQKSAGGVFSGYSSFLPQGMLTGWVGISPLTDPSIVIGSDMSHKVAASTICCQRRPSTGSGWAASFAIQLSSQLQVKSGSSVHFVFLMDVNEWTRTQKYRVALQK